MIDRARGVVLPFNEVDDCKSLIVQNAFPGSRFVHKVFSIGAFSCYDIFSGVHRVFMLVY